MITSAGLCDIQVNGFAGVDFNADSFAPGALDHALEAMLQTGVTTCLPTLITAPADVLRARFLALDAAIRSSRLGALMVPGYHLEGPFLNPAPGYCGCHPAEAMIAADPALIDRLEEGLSRPILMVTLAPEREGALALTKTLAKSGKVVAIGHSAADFATVRAAAEAGAMLSTHLGNGLPQTLPKLDNTLFAQLGEDRLAASFIADGIHLPPEALKVLLRAKGLERSVLTTDAVLAAMSAPGRYNFAGMVIEHKDGAVRQPGGLGLAGSALTLDEAVRNIVRWSLATPAQALAMASSRPRALLARAFAPHQQSPMAGECLWHDDMTLAAVSLGYERRIMHKTTGRMP